MKQRYISLVLSVVVLFLSAGVLFVRGQNTYVAPTEAFPNGIKEVPLDTGNTGQPKANYLAPTQIDVSNASASPTGIKMKVNQVITSGSNSFGLNNAGDVSLFSSAGNILLTGTSGNLVINAQGVVLPSNASNPVTPTAGMIYYDSTGDGKVKLYNKKGWTDIGTGSASSTGSQFWKPAVSGGIYYDGGIIYVSSEGDGAFFATGNIVRARSEQEFGSLINKARAEAIQPERLACDSSDTFQDCSSPYRPANPDLYQEGDVRGDKYAECPDGYWISGNSCVKSVYNPDGTSEGFVESFLYAPITYRYVEYKFRGLTGTGTVYAGLLSGDTVSVTNVKAKNIEITGGHTDRSGTITAFKNNQSDEDTCNTREVMCPSGYIAVGVRMTRDPKCGAFAEPICAKN